MRNRSGFVLISTYWNVNLKQLIDKLRTLKVLISTYWNVNTVFTAVIIGISLCFNLNLLECKFIRNSFIPFCRVCFNLNLLECKFCFCSDLNCNAFVLISTYWNVNHRCIQCHCWVWNVLISTYWNVNLCAL